MYLASDEDNATHGCCLNSQVMGRLPNLNIRSLVEFGFPSSPAKSASTKPETCRSFLLE
jgi:hypothetical protein